jgi:hypothetical protein
MVSRVPSHAAPAVIPIARANACCRHATSAHGFRFESDLGSSSISATLDLRATG